MLCFRPIHHSHSLSRSFLCPLVISHLLSPLFVCVVISFIHSFRLSICMRQRNGNVEGLGNTQLFALLQARRVRSALVKFNFCFEVFGV